MVHRNFLNQPRVIYVELSESRCFLERACYSEEEVAMRPLRKKVWVWAVSGLALTALLWSLPAVRVEYHKAKLQSLKEKRARLMSTGLSGTDKFLLQLTGTPISAADLNHSVQKHEDALVKLR